MRAHSSMKQPSAPTALAIVEIFLWPTRSPSHPPTRVEGTAIFMTPNPTVVPHALLHNLKHNRVLHETTVILTIRTEEIPHVAPEHRIAVEPFGNGIYRIHANYGFSEVPDVPALLASVEMPGIRFDPMQTTFFLGREALVVTDRPPMAAWRKRLFCFMSQNARNATSFFQLPANRVVELGSQIEL